MITNAEVSGLRDHSYLWYQSIIYHHLTKVFLNSYIISIIFVFDHQITWIVINHEFCHVTKSLNMNQITKRIERGKANAQRPPPFGWKWIYVSKKKCRLKKINLQPKEIMSCSLYVYVFNDFIIVRQKKHHFTWLGQFYRKTISKQKFDIISTYS